MIQTFLSKLEDTLEIVILPSVEPLGTFNYIQIFWDQM